MGPELVTGSDDARGTWLNAVRASYEHAMVKSRDWPGGLGQAQYSNVDHYKHKGLCFKG
jgi:hypothetical protein